MGDAIDFSDFEAAVIALKEDETELLRTKTLLAHWAVNAGAKRWLAKFWGLSAQAIKTLAAMFQAFNADEIQPDVPLSLYNAAMETDDPQVWLAQALTEGWSSRQLRDAADILKGKHFSSTAFHGNDVIVTVWDVLTGTFAATGMPLSGAMPERAQVTVREVLQE